MFEEKTTIDYIKERSILKGQVAEAQAREKRYIRRNKNLKLLLILSVLLLFLSHCWFGKDDPARLSEKSMALLWELQQEQLRTTNQMLTQLTTPDSTFTYITEEGDYPQSLSEQFYGSPFYAYMIMMDNGIKNSRRLAQGDTLLIRYKPEVLAKSRFLEALDSLQ